MAAIERITLPTPSENELLPVGGLPGLRISIRSTTASLSDYPEWNLESLRNNFYENGVTDGACS